MELRGTCLLRILLQWDEEREKVGEMSEGRVRTILHRKRKTMLKHISKDFGVSRVGDRSNDSSRCTHRVLDLPVELIERVVEEISTPLMQILRRDRVTSSVESQSCFHLLVVLLDVPPVQSSEREWKWKLIDVTSKDSLLLLLRHLLKWLFDHR